MSKATLGNMQRVVTHRLALKLTRKSINPCNSSTKRSVRFIRFERSNVSAIDLLKPRPNP